MRRYRRGVGFEPDVRRIQAAFAASPLAVEMAAMGAADDFSRLEKNAAKRQHFIPQLLLRGFASDKGGDLQLCQMETQRRGAPRPVGIREAASRHRLYVALDEDGVKSNVIEGLFALVEDHAAPALRRFLDAPSALTDPDRATISMFVALQTMRTPAAAEQVLQLANAAFTTFSTDFFSDRSDFAARYRKRHGPDATDDEIEVFRQDTIAAIREGRVKVADGGGAAFAQGIQHALDQAPMLFDFEWTLVSAVRGFITSDRGFAIDDPTPPTPWAAQGLLSSPNSVTTVPLDKTACLRMRLRPGAGTILSHAATPREIETLNLTVYGWSEKYVFGTQHALAAVRIAARHHPENIIHPRPFCQVMLLERDLDDDSIAEENRRRGWPDYIPTRNGLRDYIVIPTDAPHPDLHARVERLTQGRALKIAGLPQDAAAAGRVQTRLIHPADL